MWNRCRRWGVSPFTGLILVTVFVAVLWPLEEGLTRALQPAAALGVAFLFFVHGAALPRRMVIAGLQQWRLHLFIFAITFLLFPLLVVPLTALAAPWLPDGLVLGFLYLAVLPSAVSSSIAYTSLARGNVAAAVCSAAGSNLLGMLLTPLLMGVLLGVTGQGLSWRDSLLGILSQMFLPFILGQVCRPGLTGMFKRFPAMGERIDQAVLLLIIYLAFAQAASAGVWQSLEGGTLAWVLIGCLALLLGVLALTRGLARRAGFDLGDEIAAVFCGSKKSLASGLPMAQVLFAGHPGLGLIVLPIMLYNQLQIMLGAVLAERYAAGTGESVKDAA